MSFIQNHTMLFTAMIDATTTAYLDGQVLSKCHKNIPSATASKALVLDQDLIHC